MDGKSFDLLHDFILKYKWKGILVEPLPDLFAELRSNYALCEGLLFENVAVTDTYETRTIYRVPQDSIKDAKLPQWVKGISSLYRDRNALGGKNGLLSGAELPEHFYARLKQHIVEEQVECVPLESLIEKHKVRRIDVLQIDTEGFDYQVFKQFDFSRFEPWFMKIEVGNLVEAEYEKVLEIVNNNSYDHVKHGLDIWAWKPLQVGSA